ncbi:hypothetical protein AMR72_07305 [Flavobacterium psychrophilum]|nr:hypothetical protein AMR72_07305 [Flavobacterium psychrophilum]AOE52333.1 hypothetical protein ALW18_07295 [Flavobacterium psychrophilum]
MKSYLTGLLFLLALASCTSKNEGKVKTITDFDLEVAGTLSGNDAIVGDSVSIAKKWAGVVMNKLAIKDTVVFTNFRIVKTKTIDLSHQDIYIMIASAAKGNIKVGTTLHLEKDKFYFDVEDISGRKRSRIIICKGSCEEEGCLPQVIISDNDKHLVCSSCADCEKTTSQVY